MPESYGGKTIEIYKNGDNDPTESVIEELDTVNGFYFSISWKEGKNFSESHWLWSNGMKKEVVISCNSF